MEQNADRSQPPGSATHLPKAPVKVKPGETKQILDDALSSSNTGGLSLCVYATQEESSDDGGSQSPVGLLEFGIGGTPARLEFDVKDGVVVSVPATRVKLHITNRNQEHDLEIAVSAFWVHGAVKGRNTRSFDIDQEKPNVRVPPFAEAVVFELSEPPPGYVALVSDSETGETYGTIPVGTVYPLHHRARWIRFMDAPPSGGIVTFFLSL